MNDYYETDLTHPFFKIFNEHGFPDKPERLWVRGKLPTCNNGRPKAVAIVGARRSTPYGENIAYKLAYDLAKLGVVIISGMAFGIDACAHRGCLDAGGITIAVLGTPIDQLYPTSNIGLARRILEKGAIISEYEPRFPVKPYCFLQRNRIVTGLSDAVVIIEAAQKSGTKYTADVANLQNKTVFAVPGDINHPMSIGCNQLIKDGCQIYTDIADVLLDIGIKSNINETTVNNATEKVILDSIKSGKDDMLDLIAETKLSTPELLQILMDLEMRNIIKNNQNNRWVLV